MVVRGFQYLRIAHVLFMLTGSLLAFNLLNMHAQVLQMLANAGVRHFLLVALQHVVVLNVSAEGSQVSEMLFSCGIIGFLKVVVLIL